MNKSLLILIIFCISGSIFAKNITIVIENNCKNTPQKTLPVSLFLESCDESMRDKGKAVRMPIQYIPNNGNPIHTQLEPNFFGTVKVCAEGNEIFSDDPNRCTKISVNPSSNRIAFVLKNKKVADKKLFACHWAIQETTK